MPQSAQTLHVTNGDSVLYSFRKAGLVGTQIAWRDTLNEGPVPSDVPLEQLSRIRADYLASRGSLAIRAFTAARFVLYSARDGSGGGPYLVEAAYPLG